MPEIWFPNLGIEIAHLDRVAFTVFGRNVYWYGIFIGLLTAGGGSGGADGNEGGKADGTVP